MNNQKVTIHIELRTVIKLLISLTVFGLLIFSLFKLFTVLLIIIMSAFLAIALSPPVNKLSSYMPGHNRGLASAAAYLIVLGTLGAFFYLAVPPIIQQTSSFIDNFPSYVDSLSSKKSSLSLIIDRYGLEDQINNVINQLQNSLSSVAGNLGASLVSGISGAITSLIILITILFLTFFMLTEGPSWIERYWNLYDNQKTLNRDKRLAKKMYKVVTSYVNGQVVIALIAAASVFVSIFALGQFFDTIPLGIIAPLTGIAFVGSLIPLFGATIAAILITFVLMLNSIPAAIIFLIFFVVYQQIESNVILPVVQSHSIQMSALEILIATIIGLYLLGIVGAAIAIPLAGSIRVLMDDYLRHKQDYKKDGSKPTQL